MDRERLRWAWHVKRIRQALGVTLLDAERLALHSPYWRRWVERHINSDMECRELALSHIRQHGSASLLEQHGNTLKVR